MSLAVARNMFAAEVLKLRRNRPIMAFAFLLSVVVVAVFFGYDAIQHASSPSQNGPAGGLDGFSRAVRVEGLFFGSLVAALIGTEAGTSDISSGVFRDLVATGRGRLSLFWVRWPAATAVTFVFTGAALLLATVLSFVFADGLPTPGAGLILQSIAWILLANALVVGFALGIGSLTGSRGATLTAVIGWQTVASQLLVHTTSLGSARDVLLTSGLAKVMPVSGDVGGVVFMAEGIAIAVLVGWAVIPTAIGAWRTVSRDA